MSFKFFALVSLIILASCGVRPSITGEKSSSRDEKIPSEFKHSEFLRDRFRFETRGDVRRGLSVKLYDLKGSFDWEKRVLEASVDITFKLECACQESVIFDSQVSEVKGATLKNTGDVLAYSIQNGKELIIDLSTIPEEVRKKEMTVSIQYATHATLTPKGEPASLIAVSRLAGDPLNSQMVYTVSEPLGASQWMPCVNDPLYRSQFAVEMKMPVSQQLIANGDLVKNEVIGNERWMKYQTRYTLPNYLMAFAQGDLTIATELHGQLPVSIVGRRGLHADYSGLLKETIRQIKAYEKLLVPYPFEKYMIVLAPEFPSGGIEHAGITFNTEIGSSQSVFSRDVGLMAHELGHQWFGDLVTVKTWDDLWIKEGMATLLAEEALRPYTDQNQTGRLNGNEFWVDEGDAIRDPSLAPDDKYTSGPYGRSAWFLSQLRNHVGEDAFWSTLRKVLTDYKYSSIGTDEFLEYFRPLVGEAFIKKCEKALVAKALPKFEIRKGTGVFDLSVTDKDESLLTPIEVRWYEESGSYEGEVFKGGSAPKSHLINEQRLLVMDPQDRHPIPNIVEHSEGFKEILKPILAPKKEPLLRKLLTLGAHHHELALFSGAPWSITAQNFEQSYRSIGSDMAKFKLIQVACEIAQKESAISGKLAEWNSKVTSVLYPPPFMGMPTRGMDVALSACKGVLSGGFFESLWTKIEFAAAHTTEVDVALASLLPMETDRAFVIWKKLAAEGPTVRSRVAGLTNLVKHIKGVGSFTAPAEAVLSKWKNFFREQLDTVKSTDQLAEIINGVSGLKDMEALPALARVVRSDMWRVWQRAYCAGVTITKDNVEAKKVFETALGDLNTIPQYVKNCHGADEPKR